MFLASRMLAGAPVSISDRPGETMWVFIQNAGPQIASLVDVFNLLSEAAKCSGSPVELLSAFIGSESLTCLLSLVQNNAVAVARDPLRLQWSHARISSLSEDFHAMLQATSTECPGLLLQLAADLIAPAHQCLGRSSNVAQRLEDQIATLLRSWCDGRAGAEVRSAQRWIDALLHAPVPRDLGRRREMILGLRRDCLRHLHACSRGTAGGADVAEWAWKSAVALGLEEARTWDALPAVAPMSDAVRGDPLHDALARLKPATTQESALYTQGLHAARQVADLLVSCSSASFIDLLTQQQGASDIVRMLGHGLVTLQLPPPASCGDIVMAPLNWRVVHPPPPAQLQLPGAILALAGVLLNIDPHAESKTLKVVELLFAALQATPDGKGRKRLRHGLIDIAGPRHSAQPAILQDAQWCPMLARQLGRQGMSGERRIVCEQLLLAWLQQWSRSSTFVDPYPVVLALKQVLAYQPQPPRSQDSQDRLAACLQQLHLGVRGNPNPAHARWADWALLALQQWTASSAPELLRRCTEGHPRYAETNALLDQLLPWWDGRDPQAPLPSNWRRDGVRRPQLLELSKVAAPPLRTRVLLRMDSWPFDAGAVPPEHVLSLAQRLLNEACLLQHTLLPPAADIDMLLEACFVHLSGCPELAPGAPGGLHILHTTVHDLAYLLAHRNSSSGISDRGEGVCWAILLGYTEGPLALEHKDVWSLLQPLVAPRRLAQPGVYPWVARKQAWQVLQALEGQLLLDSRNENIDVSRKKENAELSKKVADLALALFRNAPDFARSRALADGAQQHLQSQGGNANWPADLPVLRALFRGKAPWRGSIADVIVKFATQVATPPDPAVGAAAALLLAEKAALDVFGNGSPPEALVDLGLACLQLLKAEPLGKPAEPRSQLDAEPPEPLDVNELMCAIAAVLYDAGSARPQWESMRELLLRRWQAGEYRIAGAVLLDVVWPWLADSGGLPANMARRLVLVHAWNPPLRSRVLRILEDVPDSDEARKALADCREYERAIAREDKAQAARDKLDNQAGLTFSLRPQPYDYRHATDWASLQMTGYEPGPHRHVLEELAQLTVQHEEYVRIQGFLARTHPDLQAPAQREAAGKDWPAFWFGYDRWTTVTVTGAGEHVLIGLMLLDLLVKAFGFSTYAIERKGDTWKFNAEEVDVRALRERLYDPQARIGDALTLASRVAAERKAGKDKWHPGVSYEGVVECLVGCLLGSGMRMEAADLCRRLLDVEGLAAADLVAHCAKAPTAQGTCALLARLLILDRVEGAARLVNTDTDGVFETLARELEWRDPDLGVKARLEWATRQRPGDRGKVLQACTPALPLSLDLLTWHASMAERFDPQLSWMADLFRRQRPIDDGMRWAPVKKGTEDGRPALAQLALYPTKGLTHTAFRGVQPEGAVELLRRSGSDACDLPEDWQSCVAYLVMCEGAFESLIPPLVGATFPGLVQLNEQEAPAAMGAMADAIGRLLDHHYPQAARRLLDSVPARGRGPDWHALDAYLNEYPRQPAAAAERSSQPSNSDAFLQVWLESPSVVRVNIPDATQSRRVLEVLKACLLRFGAQEHEVKLGRTALETAPGLGEKNILRRAVQALHAVMKLWLTLRENDSAGALYLHTFLLAMQDADGADLLADIECGRVALTSGTEEDITGTRVRWTIGPGVRASGSLGQLALWVLKQGHPAGFGLLHRLMRSEGSPREQLLQEVLSIYRANASFRASSRAGWANFFALALRQPGLGADIVTGLHSGRLSFLKRWYEGVDTIAAPVVLQLLGTHGVGSEDDAGEMPYLRKLYEQADSAPVRRWIRQRAMWLGVFGDFPHQAEDAWSAEHRQILESMLAQRGFLLDNLESWVARNHEDGMLMMTLASHLPDAEQAARLLLTNIKMVKFPDLAAGPLAAVALKLPTSSAPLLTSLVREWRDCWWRGKAQALARTAVALSRALVAAGEVVESTTLLHFFEEWLKSKSLAAGLDRRSGELLGRV